MDRGTRIQHCWPCAGDCAGGSGARLTVWRTPFEVLQDRLQHAVNPAERAELMPLLEELQTQLICLRRLGDQASDAATAALLHGTCVPQPIDLLGQLREFCSICRRRPRSTRCPLP